MSTQRSFADTLATRRNHFDALRLLLALGVVFSHSYPLTHGDNNASEPLCRLTGGHVSFGSLAVGFFFAVSGLLITHSWLAKPRMGLFFRNRVMRIYPGYACCLFVCAFLLPSVAGYSGMPMSLAARAMHTAWEAATLGHYSPVGAFPGNPIPREINGSLWSIRYEFLCYVAVAIAGALGVLRWRWLILGAFGACGTMAVANIAFGVPVKWAPVLDGMFGAADRWAFAGTYFLGGASARLFMNEIQRSRILALIAAATLALSFATT